MDRIVVADDHPLFRAALRSAVDKAAPGAEVVECASLAEAKAAMVAGPVDLLLLDLKLSDSEGMAGLAALRAVANGRQLVEEIDEIRASWNERLTARRNSNAWRLLDVLARRPVLTSAAAAEELGVRQPNVYPPLRTLTEAAAIMDALESNGLRQGEDGLEIDARGELGCVDNQGDAAGDRPAGVDQRGAGGGYYARWGGSGRWV